MSKAGRPKKELGPVRGNQNKEYLEDGGITPLDVMMTAMREHWAERQRIGVTLEAARAAWERERTAWLVATAEAELRELDTLPMAPEWPHERYKLEVAEFIRHTQTACAIARECAPYVHPKLAAMEATVRGGGTYAVSDAPLTEEEWIALHGTKHHLAAPARTTEGAG